MGKEIASFCFPNETKTTADRNPARGIDLNTGPSEQTVAPEHPTGRAVSLQDCSPSLAADHENRSPNHVGGLIAVRKIFKTVEAVSGAIPGVGNFVGVAAKVGLVFVNMIEVRLSFLAALGANPSLLDHG